MKESDKIVCINTGCFWIGNNLKFSLNWINENQIYTILRFGANHDIELEEVSGIFYHEKRFVTLQQYRRLKINKIKQKK